jgi:hypothetical protein
MRPLVAHKACVQPIVPQTPQNLVQQRIHASSLKDLAELMREIHWGHRLSSHHSVIMQLLQQPGAALCGSNFAVKDGLDCAAFQLGVPPKRPHWHLTQLLPRLFMLAE